MTILEQTQDVKLKQARSGLKWWQALGFMFGGGLLTMTGLVIYFMLLAGILPSSTPLAQPEPSGKVDLTARLSQEYVNFEVMRSLSKNPISVLGVGQVKQITLQFSSNSVIDVSSRVVVLGKQFDVKSKQTIFVKDNKVAIVLVEEPQLEGFGVPVPILRGLVNDVNQKMADQINQQLTSVSTGLDANGKPSGRTPTLLKLTGVSGGLEVDFTVKLTA